MKQIISQIKFKMRPYATGILAGSRYMAVPLKNAVESAFISKSGDIVLDFKGVEVTQSFMDEVIGKLILTYGPKTLNRLIFKNCSQDVQAIISFIASDRADQYIKRNTH